MCGFVVPLLNYSPENCCLKANHLTRALEVLWVGSVRENCRFTPIPIQMESTNAITLEPITSITMTDQVEQRLREYFKQKGLKAGDALPKEVELVEVLGVSRSVIREALSRLRMLGMIDVRKRRGTVLTEPDIMGGLERILEPHLLGDDAMRQLFELRLMLEIGLGDFLFQRISKKDFLKLEGIIAREKEATHKPELLQLDVQFHSTLYHITGNQALLRFQKMLIPLFQYILDRKVHSEKPAAPATVTHADLLHILRTGTADEFRVAMKKHFEPHFSII